MHAYDMLAEGDRVLIAVSGGVDSLVLLWLLHHWRLKAPIHYDLLAVHLDMGFTPGTGQAVEERLRQQPVDYFLERTDFGRRA
ncbi:MAG: tRNA 2-thiocytidine(32) synthetase TtcA, partial [Deltaproteobacteria bacterium CG_4_10_14_3_um_filter_60_8]